MTTGGLRGTVRPRLPPALGADACLLRASRAAQARGGRVHRRGLHHLLGRGAPGGDRRRSAEDGGRQVRTPAGLEAVDTTLIDDARPGDLVLIHAGAAVSAGGGSALMCPEETDFLYPFIEAAEDDVDALLRDLAASAEGKAAESDALRERTPSKRSGRRLGQGCRGHGRAIPSRRTPLHLRERRQLDGRRIGGGACSARHPAPGPFVTHSAPGALPRRRPSRADRT